MSNINVTFFLEFDFVGHLLLGVLPVFSAAGDDDDRERLVLGAQRQVLGDVVELLLLSHQFRRLLLATREHLFAGKI